MNKKKLIIGMVIVAVLVTCIIVFVIMFNKKTNMVSLSRSEIASVVITDGNNGDMI